MRTGLRVSDVGSPPRMRGKARTLRTGRRSRGITPACAGKSYTRTCYAYNVRDHPRVCGEKCMRTGLRVSDVGSPPRMRGKARTLRTGRRSRGITPAYAGKSTGGTHAHKCARDHPRVCGEKKRKGNSPHARTGSPPRMRGKDLSGLKTKSTLRITPAYAGKSARWLP